MEWGRQMAFVNHFYFYLWDPRMGWSVLEDQRLRALPDLDWLNGHEWAKRQCEKAGIGYTALDNGFASCADPVRLQRICDRLGSGAVKSFFLAPAAPAAVPVYPGRSTSRLRLRSGVSPVRGV